jgi:parallel beta-helix repeat protein
MLNHLSHGAVVNCTVMNKGDGIGVISSSSDVLIANSTVSYCSGGIWLSGPSSCTVSGNTIRNCYSTGLGIYSLSSSFVRFNTITDCGYDGVHMLTSGSCVLANNTIHSCTRDGVYFESSDVITIANNSITSNGESGLDSYDSDLCIITDNLLTNNSGEGFMNNQGDGCLLERNSISHNGGAGIYLYYAKGCTLRNNVFQNDGLVVYGAELADLMHSVSNDTVNGKSLGYFINTSRTVIDGSDYGQFILVNCSEMEIEDASLGEADMSIALFFSDGCIVNRSLIADSRYGVYLYASDNCSVTYSEFDSCGVMVTGSSPSNWIHSFTGTTVNGLPVGYFYEQHGLALDGRAFGQVIMVNCSDSTVRDGDFQNSSMAIAAVFCSRCNVINNTLEGDSYGLYARSSVQCLIENNTITDSFNTGILVYSCDDCLLTNNTVDNCEYGVYSTGCTNCSLCGITVRRSYYAIFPRSSVLLNISSSHFMFNVYGLYSFYLNNSTIQDSSFSNNTSDGAHFMWYNRVNFTDCVFEFNGASGLYLESSYTSYIKGCRFDSNGEDGLALWGVDSCLVVENEAFKNGDYGILLHHSSDYNVVYGNMIGWNVVGNGYAYDAQNTWDDGVSTGNCWADYNGETTYSIDGPGNNVDRYPTGPTHIVGQADMSYYWGTQNVFITWTAYSAYPDSYIVFIDGGISNSSEWDGHSVKVAVPTDKIGVYNYTLFVNDTLGVWAVDTVIVTVYDNPPTIDHPYDRGYNFDTYSPPLVWHPSDQNPDSYVVYRDSDPIDSGAWNGGSISVEIAGLPLGIYNFTLFVNDTNGNYVADTIMVNVFDYPPQISSPLDVVYHVGTLGHIIRWTTTEVNPLSYCVYRNGTVYDSGPWTGGYVQISVDGLSIGNYNFTAEFADTGGNNASDTVMVTVVPAVETTTTGPTTTQTDNGTMVLIVGCWVVAILVVALIVYRGRPSAPR